jgi:anti-sigma regulatory factor (Ser/Thr protein kinase)
MSDSRSGDALTFLLSGGREAGAEARRALIAGDGELPPAVRADVLLLLTELVTNAVRHGGVGPDESLRVDWRLWPRRIRVEVVDQGTEFTQIRPRDTAGESGGWGLFLVDRIADSWGVGRSAAGTSVWFEIEFSR